jgi:hypothetical protein
MQILVEGETPSETEPSILFWLGSVRYGKEYMFVLIKK